MRKILLFLFSAVWLGNAVAQYAGITRTVKDHVLGELINAPVIVTQGGIVRGRALTDYDGKYVVKPLPPGAYDVEVIYGDTRDITLSVGVPISGLVTVNIKFEQDTGSPVTGPRETRTITRKYVVPVLRRRSPARRQQEMMAQDRPGSSVHGFTTANADNTGGIQGVVKDSVLGELINAQIIVTQKGVQKGRALTDYDGRYMVKPLPPGRYDMEITYQMKRDITKDVVIGDSVETLNVIFSGSPVPPGFFLHRGCGGREYRIPLLDLRQGAGTTIHASPDLENMPYR